MFQSYLSPCSSGNLKFGDRIQLLNAGADPVAINLNKAVPRKPTVVNISVPPTIFQKKEDVSNVINITASTNLKPNSKNIFQIVRWFDDLISHAALPLYLYYLSYF